MLDKFSVPTDNLYKFLSITGLLIMILPPIFLALGVYKLRNDTYQVQEQIIELEGLADKKQVSYEEVYQAKIALNKIQLKNKQIEENFNDINHLWWFALFISLLGAGVAALGFTLWYFKTQMIQDRILRKKSEHIT